jgi:energy-coupling factor transporter ATP-binding protein EcfA2
MNSKIYEIKGKGPIRNYHKLKSTDDNFFFWSSERFVKDNIDDYIFIVCKSNREVLFTQISEKNIQAIYNDQNKESSFIYNDQNYSCEGGWDSFTCIKVIEIAKIPQQWDWEKSLGQSPVFYIWKEGINNISGRINKIDDLLLIFGSGKANSVLNYFKSLLNGKNPQKPNNTQSFVGKKIEEKIRKTTIAKPVEIIKKIHKYIQGQGFHYNIKEIANFYLSLKTKPFVILAGISGTGKTKLVELFAEAIGYGDNEHCVIIPVKPDWTDNSDLLGYTNLNRKFEKKKLTEVILSAKENPNEPYFVVLDEMNLARVEHYFSDFLSIIETRKIERDEFSTKPLLSGNDVGEETKFRDKLVNIQIPQNLFIIGTVNMDETTFPFSKKVLDRANSIEMNQVKLDFIDKLANVEPLEGVFSDFLISDKISSKHLKNEELALLKKNDFIKKLNAINKVQTNADLQFAYRVRDEIAFYLLNSVEVEDILSWEEAFDYQVMQKILPRIQGSALSINHLLINLINHFMEDGNFDTKMHYEEDIKEELQKYLDTEPKYRRTLNKLDFMLRKYSQDGFTSFWI